MATKFTTVSKDEFATFMDAYVAKIGKKFHVDVCGVGEPPIQTFNDFDLGDWPQSVVAKVIRNDMSYPNDDGSSRPNEYQVRADLAGGGVQ